MMLLVVGLPNAPPSALAADPGSGAPPSAPSEIVGRRFGEFVVVRPLASGGMAQVFLGARSLGGDTTELAAIKRLLPHLTWEPEFVRMFLDEVKITAGLRHPNIARVLDYGTGDGGHFLAMEYVHGADLRSVLARETDEPPLDFAVGVVLGLATALDYAHRYVSEDGAVVGLVHRDVSPSNVIVGFDGSVKLLDFGIARATGRTQHTRAGTLKGKVGYMAPEQCRGDRLDARTDVFALGVLLYELTTARRAFFADNDFAVVAKILGGEFVRPTAVVDGYPPELAAVIERALRVDPARRTASAAMLAEELRDFARTCGLDLSDYGRAQHLHAFFGNPEPPRVDPRSLRGIAREQPPSRRWATPVWIAASSLVVGLVGFTAGSMFSDAAEQPPVDAAPAAEPASSRRPPSAPADAEPRPDEPEAPPAPVVVPRPDAPPSDAVEPILVVDEAAADPAANASKRTRGSHRRAKARKTEATAPSTVSDDDRKGVELDPESLLAPSLRK